MVEQRFTFRMMHRKFLNFGFFPIITFRIMQSKFLNLAHNPLVAGSIPAFPNKRGQKRFLIVA